ncbi:hypothetical protein OPV22_024200 [Ensete ventricosum]|uniref:Uncharacterized protein n=1 Tax=Ensete ventricosum TaxID=4639 RepID=A0AAV8QTT5_ENSVE|nr:hypothetical protein OPV22_024200 [Ensete ventricosum]RWW70993.1 hypothetical protein BHE74_00021300 [Ensete ventricosum]
MGVCEKLFTALHFKSRGDSATSKPPPAKAVKEETSETAAAATEEVQKKKKKKNINERAAEYIKTARVKIRAGSFSRVPTTSSK